MLRLEPMEAFRIHVEEAVLDDLQARLQRTRWSPLSDEGWTRGTDRTYLRELVGKWQSDYDWRLQEAGLNQLAQWKARASGADVHFVHVKGGRPPLLLLHGWPDSYLRYLKVLPQLAEHFDLVIPSLPGFAFTGPVSLSAEQPTRHSAKILFALMTDVLRYPRFGVAGGDGGSVLAQILAIDHPESVVGIHLTDLGWHAAGVDPRKLTRSEKKYLEAAKKSFMTDGAYAMVQATDLLLSNIMLYWVTGTIGSSIYGYFADRRSPSITPADRVERPVGMALFPDDIGGVPPRALAERTLNVRRWTEMPRGGHFAALEEPGLYANDVREFFQSLEVHARTTEESHATV
jgi:pimeloyl-ACP methyl ester carboxylesterase